MKRKSMVAEPGERERKRLYYYLSGAVAAAVVVIVAVFVYLAGSPAHPRRDGADRIVVPQGASAWKVGYLLRDSGLIESPRRFAWHLKYRGMSEQLKAGVYDIPRSASMREMANRIIAADEVMVEVTFPEGWNSHQMASLLQTQGVVDSLSFVKLTNDPDFIAKMGLNVTTLEGFLYPETYVFRLRRDPEEIIQTMIGVFHNKVGVEWFEAAEKNELGLQGVVTLASIVQGEFQLPGEAPDIAAVYQNRLNQDMLLQADPTIQYILPEGPRRLTLGDLTVRNPYNTYRYKGLPPGPINNPGLEALQSALNPPDKPWLYMVARGDGGHTFTTNYDDHLRAKRRLDAIRRQEARRKREAGN